MQADDLPRLLGGLEVLLDPGRHLGVVALARARVAQHDHVGRTVVEGVEVERGVGGAGEATELCRFLRLRELGGPRAFAGAVLRGGEEVVGCEGVRQRRAQFADIGVMVAEHRVEGDRGHQRRPGLLGGLGGVHVGRPVMLEVMEAPAAGVDDIAQRHQGVGFLLGDAVGDRVLTRLAVGEVAHQQQARRLVRGFAGVGGPLGEDLAAGAEHVGVFGVGGQTGEGGDEADVLLRLLRRRQRLGGRRGELELGPGDLRGRRRQALGRVLEGEGRARRLRDPDDLDLIGRAQGALRARLDVGLHEEGGLGGDGGDDAEQQGGEEGHGGTAF